MLSFSKHFQGCLSRLLILLYMRARWIPQNIFFFYKISSTFCMYWLQTGMCPAWGFFCCKYLVLLAGKSNIMVVCKHIQGPTFLIISLKCFGNVCYSGWGTRNLRISASLLDTVSRKRKLKLWRIIICLYWLHTKFSCYKHLPLKSLSGQTTRLAYRWKLQFTWFSIQPMASFVYVDTVKGKLQYSLKYILNNTFKYWG